MAAKCQVCGFENLDSAPFCDECGVKLDIELPSSVDGVDGDSDRFATDDDDPDVPIADGDFDGVDDVATGDGVACASCGAAIGAASSFCAKCGVSVATSGTDGDGDRCAACRARIEADDAFCNTCGARVDDARQAPAPTTSRGGDETDVAPEDAVFRLVVVTGHEKDRVFSIGKDEARLGRSPENDVILDTDGYVSSRHTRVFRDGDDFFVEDLGSTNGTFIKVKQRIRLEPGDEIKIGQSIFRFES